jgi:hypothetical protein
MTYAGASHPRLRQVSYPNHYTWHSSAIARGLQPETFADFFAFGYVTETIYPILRSYLIFYLYI